MRAYSNAIKAGVLGLSLLAAAPAFTSSAYAGPAPSVDITAIQQDPVHQAAISASAHKIVFVLGEGFGRRALNALKRGLADLSLIEDKHYVIMNSAAAPTEGGVMYLAQQIIKAADGTSPFTFDQYETPEAVSLIRLGIKAGKITIAAADLTP